MKKMKKMYYRVINDQLDAAKAWLREVNENIDPKLMFIEEASHLLMNGFTVEPFYPAD